MILSFPYLVVILTTLGTPKNTFCVNNNIMNDNSKQNQTTRARTSLVVLYLRNYAAGIHGHYMNLQIILNTQKNPYLNQATQKNTCQIFIPKKIPESKISNPEKSFDHPRHLKSGVPPLGYFFITMQEKQFLARATGKKKNNKKQTKLKVGSPTFFRPTCN